MDSLTQITLGAAVGELVLGRKIGNRAMAWGAVAGTLPDLDVLSNLVTDELSALAYHRAFTHSLTYALIVPLLLGPLVHHLYRGDAVKLPRSRWLSWLLVGVAFIGVLALGSYLMPLEVYGVPQIALAVGAASMVFPALILLREQLRKQPHPERNVSWQAWSTLFFFAIVTHPLLDCSTTYGTQLFEPFSNTRIAWNNISVADPLYTLPFLLCVIIVLFLRRTARSRRWINLLGIGWSLLYLAFTVFNKLQVNRTFEQSLDQQEIVADRYLTTPSILNNILWQGVAEGNDAYYMGQYSLLDARPVFQLIPVQKGHHLLADYPDSRDLRMLRWFTDGYYSISRRADGSFQFSDLRFGSMSNQPDNPDDYIFKFILTEDPATGELRARQSEDMPSNRDMGELMDQLWTRIKGID